MRHTIRNIILISILVICHTATRAQEFFNLTADEVKIDSMLPCFTFSKDLGTNYSDSTYEVSIEYPEFLPMTKGDIARYLAITSDSLPSMPVVNTTISVDRKRGVLDVSFVPLACRDGVYSKLVSFKLNFKTRHFAEQNTAFHSVKHGISPSKIHHFTTPSESERYAANSVLREGRWVKIGVDHSGVYQLTDELVRKAGFSDPSKVKIYGYGGALVPETLTDAYLRQTDDLKQVPTCVVNGRRLFYAQGPVTWTPANDRKRNPYSTHGCYFLTSNDEEALTMTEEEFVESFYPNADYQNTLYEVDDYAWYAGGRNLYDSRLLSATVPSEYALSSVADAPSGTLRVVLSGDVRSEVKVSINDSLVGTMSIQPPTSSYQHAVIASRVFRIGNIKATNKVKLEKIKGNNIRLDYIVLHNNKTAPAPDLSAETFPVPKVFYGITNQNHHADTPVDMIIILPTSQHLRSEAERLKALHEQYNALTVRIVPADELFNEFSSGTPDASAYRRYLKMFYDRATTDSEIPKYLILFGDGAWDNRMLSSDWRNYSPDDYLLCFESENSLSSTRCFVSDDFFCLLDDGETISDATETEHSFRGKVDVAVGRYTVRNLEQAKVMVDKVEAYMKNTNAGAWQNTIVFMGDDGNDNIHMDDADMAAKVVEDICPSFDVKRIMWDSYKRTSSATGFSYPDVTNSIRKYMNSGALMMNYTGHGSPYTLSHEQVIGLDDFANTTTNCLPLWFTASCDIMPFDSQESTIGETAVLNSKGGAVAFFGTTRTVYSHQNRLLNLAFTKLVADPSKDISIGEAARRAKNSLVDAQTDLTVNKFHYALIGDPALRLALPRLKVVIDHINGKEVNTTDKHKMKAGEVVKVSGHIEENGILASDFDGLMTAMVNDAKQEVVCRLNDTGKDGAKEPFVYEDYSGTVFRGTDSIRAGRFEFSFVVPRDITYADGAGDIKIYAVNNDRTKMSTGNTNSIVFNGSASLSTDSIGPSIYSYLNSSAFSNGDAVNATPFFMAELRDEDGINAAGSGIGHDMQLIIDGDPAKTYSLNDYFTFDFGSYQSGTVGFSIPYLEEGEHRLLFRAWDVLNNSNTCELIFTVSNSVSPRLFDVECLKNPAVGSTTFRIVHDRIGSNLDVDIEIFDMSGRHLGTHSVSGVPGNTTFTVDWDLTVNGGRPLNTGIYLYRACISSNGSEQASKVKKLIVISNK